jgi:hypothetical protein
MFWVVEYRKSHIQRKLMNELKIRFQVLIALMLEAVTSSETSVSIYQTTRRNIPEDRRLNTMWVFTI